MRRFISLDAVTHAILFGIALLTPLLYVSLIPERLEFHKQTVLIVGTSLLLLAWLVHIMRRQEVTVNASRVHFFAFLFVLVSIPAALTSTNRFASIFGFGTTSSSALLTLVAFFVLYLIAAAFLTSQGSLNLLRTLLLSAFIVSLTAPLALTGAFTLSGDPTTVGNIGTLSFFLGSALLLSLGGAMVWRGPWQRFALLSTLYFLLLGAFVFFQAAWLIIALVTLLLVAFILFRLRRVLSDTSLILPAFILGLTFILYFVPPALPRLTAVSELSPSFSTSIAVDRAATGEHFFTGFGQGQWQNAYARFFPQNLNETPFWNVRFVSGSSKLTTLPAEIGFFGLASWLLFIFAIGAVSIRRLLRASADALPVLLPGTLLWLGLVIGSVFFIGTMTTELFFWLVSAMLIATATRGSIEILHHEDHLVIGDDIVVAEEEILATDSDTTNWRFSLSRGSLGGQIVLLLTTFSLVAALGLGYFIIERYGAARSFTRGMTSFNQGDYDAAIGELARAAQREENNAFYWQALSEASHGALLVLSPDDNNQAQRIRILAQQAINASDRAVALVDASPQIWAQRGQVFASLAPLGFENAAEESIGAWEQAAALDPRNPSYPVASGRAKLLILQSGGDDANRSEALQSAKDDFAHAVTLKSDYAPAHYQLAVVASILDNQEEAVAHSEAAVKASPKDPDLRLQLGLLYYNTERLDEAALQFNNALVINPNDANARYFLALVFARQGKTEEAVGLLVWLIDRNPELDFLKTILDNVRERRDALEGVARTQGTGEAPEPLVREPETTVPEFNL